MKAEREQMGAAAVASHLVKVEPENAGWWINLAYSVRRIESVEKAGSHSAASASDSIRVAIFGTTHRPVSPGAITAAARLSWLSRF
jgi:hypothetical protein